MIKKVLLLFLFAFVLSCDGEKKTPEVEDNVKSSDSIVIEVPKTVEYPEALNNVFKAHGGLDTWNEFQKVVFNVHKSRTIESHEVNLKSDVALIQANTFTLGANQENIWIKSKGKHFTQDPKFYKDFYYYFVAMPFVLGDEGVMYNRMPPLRYKGVGYPGYKASFKQDQSPVTHYFLYYHPKTYKVTWLGYTIPNTEKIAMVRYEKLHEIKGLLLPSKITWYKFNNNAIGGKTNSIRFSAIELSTQEIPKELVIQPAGATSY